VVLVADLVPSEPLPRPKPGRCGFGRGSGSQRATFATKTTARPDLGGRVHRWDHLQNLAVGRRIGGQVQVAVRPLHRHAEPSLVGDRGPVLLEGRVGVVQADHPELLALEHGHGQPTLPTAPLRAREERAARRGDGRVARRPHRHLGVGELDQVGHGLALVVARSTAGWHGIPAVVRACDEEVDLVVTVGAVLDGEGLARRGEGDALHVAVAVVVDARVERGWRVADDATAVGIDPQDLAAERRRALRVGAHRGVARAHPDVAVGPEPRPTARVTTADGGDAGDDVGPVRETGGGVVDPPAHEADIDGARDVGLEAGVDAPVGGEGRVHGYAQHAPLPRRQHVGRRSQGADRAGGGDADVDAAHPLGEHQVARREEGQVPRVLQAGDHGGDGQDVGRGPTRAEADHGDEDHRGDPGSASNGTRQSSGPRWKLCHEDSFGGTSDLVPGSHARCRLTDAHWAGPDSCRRTAAASRERWELVVMAAWTLWSRGAGAIR